jgi:V/A-type H+/Na+-transporting ATPase subunit I
MSSRDAGVPVRMQRVVIVAPCPVLRAALVQVADAGTVELDRPSRSGDAAVGEAGRRLTRLPERAGAAGLAAQPPDLDLLERNGRADLLAGEAQLEERAGDAVVRDGIAALAGWMSVAEMTPLRDRLDGVGAAVVPLLRPPGAEPPTQLPSGAARRSFAPLVETYATVRYSDVDPSLLAGAAYTLMFGMMFADAGHGAVLLLGALLVRAVPWRRTAPLREVWLLLAGAGLASCVFGLLYGEFFGPTGVLPVLWLAPLEQPVQLLLAAGAVGAVLLAGAYALGSVNRWREAGWRHALYAPSGLAGAGLFLGLGLVAAGWYRASASLLLAGVAVAAVGLLLTFAGLLAEAGGGTAGTVQASVELFDTVVRLAANLVSFARLAAFGLTHAALSMVVWDATRGLWARGAAGAVAAVLVFVLGNAVSFALEALVAGVQALRLEYYELFSRVFTGEGRPFRPWHVPVVSEVASP